ncbi:DnaB-like helicase N-terminal domain-containing protein [Streptomyces sp. HPF1205]|uniref:DnaB-like helicase N-terminal domain-containing protein n=1 Tax=Streptomyces sp. HPF1205 TaxID=2873262 RepID=UPI001CEDB201|nr:DnaB-like helicase N-terminal domain-containing protein [Streptomyces sp. HPF1205]
MSPDAPTDSEEPYGPELQEVPHYAEQALLGALLLDPAQLAAVPNLLPEHFANPSHTALFTAMCTLIPPEPEVHRARPVWLTAVLTAAVTSAPGLDAPYLHTLITACPKPEHAAAYGQMIRAEHLRRALREHALRLEQLSNDPTLPDPTTTVCEQADTLTRFFNHAEPHWPRRPGPIPKAAGAPPRAGPCEEDLDEERLFLATATAHPGDLTQLGWLHSEDFSVDLHEGLHRCLTAMARRDDPIDPLTVLWQAQQHAVLIGTNPAQVLDFLRQPAGSAEHWAERIYTRALLTTARTAAREIIALTNDPAYTPHHLIPAGRRTLAELARMRARRRAPPPRIPPAAAVSPRAPAFTAKRPFHANR